MPEDYSQTVLLPKTEFPMRANLPQREAEILSHWQEIGLWQKLRDLSTQEDRPKFILHDGPPYANGHLHIGHAANKILKDVINRSWQGRGYDAHYIPGWDCHGLPIEWKVEENFRAQKRDKQDIAINDFRAECREFAEKWVAVQKEEFQRLGIMGEWDRPYLTMDFKAEAMIAKNIGKFLMQGRLYKGARPVMWSVVERTALAEAEIEYRTHKSPSIWVRFPICEAEDSALRDAAIVIWTTTPWTIPGNRGIAYHRDLDYVLVEIHDAGSDLQGAKMILAASLVEDFKQAAKIADIEILAHLETRLFSNLKCYHPLYQQGYDFTVPAHHADFVTDAQGTGFVHIGPANGSDDYQFALKHSLEVPDNIADDGAYRDNVPLFAGKRVLFDDGSDGDANGAVIGALKQAGHLLAKQSYRHPYPHSWRSKAPVIYRNTAQWFIRMESDGVYDALRGKALASLENVNFFPEAGKTRLSEMIEDRPDWCVSRQRSWGVPLPIFINRKNGEVLCDQKVLDRIIAAFEIEGADCWFSSPKSRFLGDEYDADDYEQVRDVVDVWFDSGSTHSFVLNEREGQHYPADLYLEGSDQHRGWFQSSLLVAAGLSGSAPYKNVLTHGFALDKDGKKMSKSIGNVIASQDITNRYGADILRLWAVSADYSDDTRMSDEILKRITDSYRRIRNSLRFMLGNLNDTIKPETIPYDELPELEQYVLDRMFSLDKVLQEFIDHHDYTHYSHKLYHFCQWLSYGYFDIRKDCLYCESQHSPKRQACLYVLHLLFDFVVTRISPILCFTAEEAWQRRWGKDSSVVLQGFSAVPDEWHNPALREKWQKIFKWRDLVNGAIEAARREGSIKSSLEANISLELPEKEKAIAQNIDWAEIFITAPLSVVYGTVSAEAAQTMIAGHVAKAKGEKCERCWRVLEEVKQADNLCGRCRDVIGG